MLTLWDNDLEGPIPDSWADLQVCRELEGGAGDAHVKARSRLWRCRGHPMPQVTPREGSRTFKGQDLDLEGTDASAHSADNLLCHCLDRHCHHPFLLTQSLEVLDLSYNNLVGELPEAFAAMGSLRELLMDVNRFSGPLPGELRVHSLTLTRLYLGFILALLAAQQLYDCASRPLPGEPRTHSLSRGSKECGMLSHSLGL
jgi:hypothetical protein